MSAEWTVTCDIRFTDIESNNGNIFHFKSGDHVHGFRHPALYSKGNSTNLVVKANVNGDLFHSTRIHLELNVKAHIEIHQRYVSKGNYRFFIIKDGEEIFSIINDDAQPVYNTHVYASNEWFHSSTVVMLSNLEFTNFL